MISSSFLLFAFGIRGFRCNSFGYKSSKIVLNIQKDSSEKRCPCCKSRNVVWNGYVWRDIKTVPIGHVPVLLHTKIRRMRCKECGCDQNEHIHFIHGKRTYSTRLENLVMDMLQFATIKSVAGHLHLTWDTVKEIHKRRLTRRYIPLDIRGVRNIGIDEFAVRKGHVYKTIVVDLDTGRIFSRRDLEDVLPPAIIARAIDGYDTATDGAHRASAVRDLVGMAEDIAERAAEAIDTIVSEVLSLMLSDVQSAIGGGGASTNDLPKCKDDEWEWWKKNAFGMKQRQKGLRK